MPFGPPNVAAMQHRTLGRTGLRVSAVGFGTAQLRRVPHTQAIDTLLKGFDLGVNIVHTAPDYEGAEDLIAAAVARTPRHVIVASNAYDAHFNRTGRAWLFEHLFERTCRKLRTDRLDLFGVASVEDREALGENVWGRGGMVDFLQRKKAQGRLGATFCTTHGEPRFIKKLVESGAFDAIMIAFNDLGFHLLTLNPPAGWHFENIARNRLELFDLCRRHSVGLMIMLPLAGGLLCRGKAFPSQDQIEEVNPEISAADALRSILSNPDVGCVLPGTASVEEAEENARAGHSPLELSREARRALGERISVLQSTLCSRCGLCEPLCSQKLPISWMFRAGYMSLYPSSPYETWETIEYFRLHPKLEATCGTCPDVTCTCPAGIDVPRALIRLNDKMVERMRRGEVAPPVHLRQAPVGNAWFNARVVIRELPARMRPGRKHLCRLFLENTGLRPWLPHGRRQPFTVRLTARVNGALESVADLRHPVIPRRRCHFVFHLPAPRGCDRARVTLRLVRQDPWGREPRGLLLFDDYIPVREER